MAEPFVRRAGSGPGVVCLHANASSSAQWRGLIEQLSPRYTALAVDSYGSGRSPDWPSDTEITLHDEVALIEPVLAQTAAETGAPVVLVGHSYGAAVALIATLEHPEHVRALAVYEPTLFALVDAEGPPPNDADGIRDAVADAALSLEAGDTAAAGERFIDYWMGAGSWAKTPAERRTPLAASIVNIRRWGHALFTEPTPREAFRSLEVPSLFLMGGRSRAPAHGVARVLMAELPRIELVEFESLGHMGPVTDPQRVNSEIERFVEGL